MQMNNLRITRFIFVLLSFSYFICWEFHFNNGKAKMRNFFFFIFSLLFLLYLSCGKKLNSTLDNTDIVLDDQEEHEISGVVKPKSLTINPGTTLIFSDHVSRIIVKNGSIKVEGSYDKKIVFKKRENSTSLVKLLFDDNHYGIFIFCSFISSFN